MAGGGPTWFAAPLPFPPSGASVTASLFSPPLAALAFPLRHADRSSLWLFCSTASFIAIFCLQVFGNDQPVFWRESSSGLNVTAFFLARIWINSFDLLIQTFLFTALYFLIRQPGVPFWIYMVPFLLVTFAASGWGYLISTLFPPKHGPFIASLVVFIVCCVLGDPSRMNDFLDGGIFEVIVSVLSITRWSVAMSVNYQEEYTDPRPSTAAQQEALLASGVPPCPEGKFGSDTGVLTSKVCARVRDGGVESRAKTGAFLIF